MSAGVPGPWRRLVRQPQRAVAIGLLVITTLAAAGIQSAAAAALQSTIDTNWRGAYDILVTSPGGLEPIGGMLPPNTLRGTGKGLSLDALAEVRTVPGVEVAAPIGHVLTPGLKLSGVTLAVPKGLPGAAEAPQAFRLTATYTTDDGLGERIVWRDTIATVVDETLGAPGRLLHPECGQDPLQETALDEFSFRWGDYPKLTAFLCAQGPQIRNGVATIQGDGMGFVDDRGANGTILPAYPLALPAFPLSSTEITLVDPVAEKALLGASGTFLDALISAQPDARTDLAAMQGWANRTPGAYSEQFLESMKASTGFDFPDSVMDEVRALWASHDQDWDEWESSHTIGGSAVPLLISDAQVADFSVKVDIESFGSTTRVPQLGTLDSYVVPPALKAGETGTLVGTVVGDASSALNPFIRGGGKIFWPGMSHDDDGRGQTSFETTIQAAGKSQVVGYDDSAGRISLTASGYRSPVYAGSAETFSTSAQPRSIGSEASFAALHALWSLASGAAPIAVPVGSFDPASVAVSADSAAYVPLGAYGVVGSTVVGGEHAGATMRPSITGTGLVGSRTVAIASIDSASMWNDASPVDAIRVRVGGIQGYTRAAQQRVVEVAAAIEKLGLSATIVAGSSPTDVEVHVDGYAFGTMDPNGKQTVGALGDVVQRWSELGAASRVSLSVSTATYVILGIALAAAILLLGAVQVAGIPGRREQAVVMREIGFTRVRIARWYAIEELPGVAIVAAAGVIAVWSASARAVAASAAVIALGVVAAFAVAAVVAGSRSRPLSRARDARSVRLGARSVAAFGVRQVFIHPLTSIAHLIAMIIVGLGAAGLAAAVLTGRAEAGESSLALLATGRQLWPQLALGATGVAGGLMLAHLVRRIDLSRRADQWAAARAVGWTSGQLATAQHVEGIAVAAPAALIVAALAWLGSILLELDQAAWYVAIALTATILTALVAFSARRKGSVA